MLNSKKDNKQNTNSIRSRNWEADISYVSIKPCDRAEDPLGCKVVFHSDAQDVFEVGASFLEQREVNLKKAGFQAPMTGKAIALVEEYLGATLRVRKKLLA